MKLITDYAEGSSKKHPTCYSTGHKYDPVDYSKGNKANFLLIFAFLYYFPKGAAKVGFSQDNKIKEFGPKES